MNLRNKIKNMSDDEIIEYIKNRIKILERQNAYIESGQAYNDFFDLAKDDMTTKANNIIKKWYDSYDRHYYKPSYSLFESYRIKEIKGNPTIVYSNDYIPKVHRVDAVNDNYIYDYIFSEGWHGGAIGIKENDPDIPYIPTPPKKFHAKRYNGDAYHPWNMETVPWKHNRWIMAENDESIKEGLDKLIKYYKDEGLLLIWNNFKDIHFVREE